MLTENACILGEGTTQPWPLGRLLLRSVTFTALGLNHLLFVSSCSGDRLDPTAVNILQQIIELGTETHDATAVASVVAMAPGTVTVVKQVGPAPGP